MTDFVIDLVKDEAKTLKLDLTDQQIEASAERARDIAKANGGGIAQLYTDHAASAKFIVKEAISDTMAKLKAKGETDVTASDLAECEAGRLAFGNAGAAAPLKHRGEYIRKYGQAKYDAAMKLWGASATDLTPRKNPFTKPVRRAMREAREGTLEATPFNLTFNADQVRAPPKPPKVKVKGGPMTMTELGALYKSDPAAARAIALKNGLKI
jgi:hypothetical protein